jgi:hypothetical protein
MAAPRGNGLAPLVTAASLCSAGTDLSLTLVGCPNDARCLPQSGQVAEQSERSIPCGKRWSQPLPLTRQRTERSIRVSHTKRGRSRAAKRRRPFPRVRPFPPQAAVSNGALTPFARSGAFAALTRNGRARGARPGVGGSLALAARQCRGMARSLCSRGVAALAALAREGRLAAARRNGSLAALDRRRKRSVAYRRVRAYMCRGLRRAARAILLVNVVKRPFTSVSVAVPRSGPSARG